jgi:hypothetical protein
MEGKRAAVCERVKKLREELVQNVKATYARLMAAQNRLNEKPDLRLGVEPQPHTLISELGDVVQCLKRAVPDLLLEDVPRPIAIPSVVVTISKFILRSACFTGAGAGAGASAGTGAGAGSAGGGGGRDGDGGDGTRFKDRVVKAVIRAFSGEGPDSSVVAADARVRSPDVPRRSKWVQSDERRLVVSVGEAEVKRGVRDPSIITLKLPEPLVVCLPPNSTWCVELHPYLLGLSEIAGDFTFPGQPYMDHAPKTVKSIGFEIECVMNPAVIGYTCRPMGSGGAVDVTTPLEGLIRRAAVDVRAMKTKYASGMALQVRVVCHES